ncbi:MAG: NAD(P)/FAD-dependent oxidoreductase [Acidobacteriota bacterium]|nr:NAD(P)/FAD-dependent oxidoreductase [Acidobacteriota bacterium]
MPDTHRVVILGGGFGGLYAAKALGKLPVQLTLIDRRNFHLFQPLLYQVATGALSPGEIASPLRAVLNRQKNTRVLLGEAVDIDVQQHRVKLDTGDLEYDTLIVATGSRNFYFGNEAWESNAPGLKTIEEATQIRHKILYAFEAAEREPDPEKRREWLTFVVVGAGPTGCELAGALGEIAHDTLKNDFRSIRPEEARILLLEGSPRVLPPFPPDLSHKAEQSLIRLGVRARTNVRVTEIDDHGVTLNDGERIQARTVIWAAGVRASPLGALLAERTGAKLDPGGRIAVNDDCSIPWYPDIFVIGDLARFEQDGKPLAGVAQVAMQQGGYVAKLIGKRLKGGGSPSQGKPFRYFDKGNLAVIGRAAAVAQIGKLHFSGLFAWLIWLFIHLMYLVEFSNRLLVFVHWGYLYLTFNRGARLITGKNI